jgi:hydrogenase nickel incorporation protein HypB
MMQNQTVIPDVDAAAEVRRRLHDAGVLTLSISGGPGAGKTALLEQMLRRLRKDFNVGVIVGNPKAERDLIRLQPVAHFVSRVPASGLSAIHVRDQLDHGEIPELNVLFIEVGSDYTGFATPDVGQDMRVAVFSVAAGDDKAVAFPHRVRTADLVLLNKMDLLPHVAFDPRVFRADVQRINSAVPVMEVTATRANGVDPWERWLRAAIAVHQLRGSRQSFGATELFLG